MKFLWNHRRPWIDKVTLNKKNKSGGIIIPDFIIYYRTIVIKAEWLWQKNKNVDQWN